MKKYAYTIQLDPEPEGGFTVTVPALPGCVTWGRDRDHALEMAQEAIAVYIETLLELKKPIPDDPGAANGEVVVHIDAPAGV